MSSDDSHEVLVRFIYGCEDEESLAWLLYGCENDDNPAARLLYGWDLMRPVEFVDLVQLASWYSNTVNAPKNYRLAEEGPDQQSRREQKRFLLRLLVYYSYQF